MIPWKMPYRKHNYSQLKILLEKKATKQANILYFIEVNCKNLNYFMHHYQGKTAN